MENRGEMKTTRVIEITVETDEIVVISRRTHSGWCAGCKAQVKMLPPEEATHLSGMNWLEMSRRIASGQIHVSETTDQLLICNHSLLQGTWRSL